MMTPAARQLFRAAIASPFVFNGLFAAESDPGGILRKPIADKLIVLTFDGDHGLQTMNGAIG